MEQEQELKMVLLALEKELVQMAEEPELEVEQALGKGSVQMVVGLAPVVEEQALVLVLGPPRAHYHRR